MKYLTVVLGLFLVSGNSAHAFYQINILFDERDFVVESNGGQSAQKTDKDGTKTCPCDSPSPQWPIIFTNPMS